MLDLSARVPAGVSLSSGEPRLRWQCDDHTSDTSFDRFRVVGVSPVEGEDEKLEIIWRDFGDQALDDPFYKEAMEIAAKARSRSSVFRTSQDVLEAVARQQDLPFNGVIFHMARTGSTLIHRLLSRTGRVHSLSEIAMLDRAILLTTSWSEDARNAFMRDLLATFRRARRPAEQHFVTKMTDGGGNVRLPLYRAAFPEVPWIFVYRDPVEVMVSILLRPTGNIENWYKNRTRSAERLGMPMLNDPGMWPEEFVARTLRRFCTNAITAARASPPGKFLAVPYSRLPDAIWETIAPHFNIEITDEDREAMRAEAQYSAKKTDSSEFRPDSDKKRDEATPLMRAMAERFVAPVMEELKSLPQA